MKEIWKDIPNYENYYQVSDLGNVKRKNSIIYKNDNTIQTYKEKMLAIMISSNGYPSVTLYALGKCRMYNIHSLIGMAFFDRDYIKKGFVVNHINGVKTDSFLSNLELTNHTGNLTHAYKNKLNQNLGENHNWSKYSNKVIADVKIMFSKNDSINDVYEKYGISKVYLRQIRRKARRTIVIE